MCNYFQHFPKVQMGGTRPLRKTEGDGGEEKSEKKEDDASKPE